ncbi:MAG TPA: hypothetical protein QF716_01640 [Candidatus Thalassarchaeaceae archaeon]|jgi:hypothetical protein|nr:hypothetical protein [Candidatus Thalassarchaeaceae archaeon]HJM67563.1 hypothetical protein [Candidatus Thalassarchaeaceae archaeon]
MTVYTSLLSTLVGGLHMDAWLENWIDELEAEYEGLKAVERKHLAEKSTHRSILGLLALARRN